MKINANIVTPGYLDVSTGVKFNKTQSYYMIFHNLATGTETTPVAGQAAFDTDNVFKYYNGTKWVVPAEAMTTEDFQDKAGAMVISTASVTMTYDDSAGTISSVVNDNTSKQKVTTQQDGTVKGTRANINFVSHANLTATITDNSSNDRVDIQLTPTGLALSTHNHSGVYQPISSELTGIASLASTGIVVRTAAGTYVTRGISADSTAITISNSTGVGGNIGIGFTPGNINLSDLGGTLPVNKGGTGLSAQLSANFVMAENGAGTALTGKAINGTTNRVIVNHSDTAITLSTPQDLATTSSPTFSKVTITSNPVAASDATSKSYVDSMAAGLSVKEEVDVMSTGNVTLSGIQNIDGVTGAVGLTVFNKYQTNAVENGVWEMASGAWTRRSDMDTWSEFNKAYVSIKNGTTNAGTSWVCATDATSGSTILATTWNIFGRSLQYSPGAGIAGSGTGGRTFDVGAGNGIEVAADSVAVKLATTSGLEFSSGGLKVKPGSNLTIDGNNLLQVTGVPIKRTYTINLVAGTAYSLTNEFGTKDVLVTVQLSTGERIYLDETISASYITLTSLVSITSARVIVIG